MRVQSLLGSFDNVPTAAVFNVCVFLWLLCGVQYGFTPLQELETGHEAMCVATMHPMFTMALPVIIMAVTLQGKIRTKSKTTTIYSISYQTLFNTEACYIYHHLTYSVTKSDNILKL